MGANLTDAIQKKLTKLAESAPNLGKIIIIGDDKAKEQIDAIVTFAQGLGIEVSVEPRENIAEALEKAAELHSISFEINEVCLGEEAVKLFEREVNALRIVPKPIVMESSKQFLDKGRSMHREHMKQMRRYQNKHWKR
jgi:hypothetical protein